ncbi:YcjX family protein [Coralliovum pocilloporae]|uniref:YcjX family protein n=1 Tax=Coralliovum pocilloporae TaxID=3066369 RepID=UPI0033077779
MPRLTSLTDEAKLALDTLKDQATSLTTPVIKLGVTGLSRSGKTIFITALLNHLINGGRLPLFEPFNSGRITRAYLEHQPDDLVPRFNYERHLGQLNGERLWPQSTHSISEMRLTIEYESDSLRSRLLGGGRLHLDIVDYPGEWLLDLPLLSMTYRDWCLQAHKQARHPARLKLAGDWLEVLEKTDPATPADEVAGARLAQVFTDYLKACRHDAHALSYLPPGRFLMPGDLAGSPALTFAPLVVSEETDAPNRHSLWAMMERRFEAYKNHVVRPFFRDHFARLDRQIVLVDLLSALNAGPDAVTDLEQTLQDVLQCFRPGRTAWLSKLLSRRIDRILFAATKADHLHQADHDRLAAILKHLVSRVIDRAEIKGAGIDVTALASIRATREAEIQTGDEAPLPAIIGTPQEGERINEQTFDGNQEIAIFPGDLPDNPDSVFKQIDSASEDAESASDLTGSLRFVRFRPPLPTQASVPSTHGKQSSHLPHIRLDKALHFLIGDQFQ